jgi:hypothetical protein
MDRARRAQSTGHDLLTDKQTTRLQALIAVEEHVLVRSPQVSHRRNVAAMPAHAVVGPRRRLPR